MASLKKIVRIAELRKKFVRSLLCLDRSRGFLRELAIKMQLFVPDNASVSRVVRIRGFQAKQSCYSGNPPITRTKAKHGLFQHLALDQRARGAGSPSFPRKRESMHRKTSSPLQSFACSLAGFSLFLVLHGYLLATYGQTIGKWVCGIRIVRADRSKASLWRILLLRDLPVVLIAAIPVPHMFPVLAMVDALLIFRQSRQCLHDQVADTVVVNV